MGTGASSKRSACGVRKSITNYGLRTTNFRACFRVLVFLCGLCGLAGNISAQTIESLAEQIRSGSTEQKRSALFEIRNRQTPEASRAAIPALTDSDEIVRATAAFSVIYLPKDEAFNALSPNLQDKAEIVRRETALALGKIQNPNSVNALISAFQKEKKSVEVKNACLQGLGETGDASAIEFLTQTLQQKPKADDDFLRRSTALSIGQIAQIIQIKKSYTVSPESFLPEKFKLFALEKYQNLSASTPQFQKAVPVLIEVLQNTKESGDARREAAFALGAIGDVSALSVLQSNSASKDYYLAEICKESIKKLASVNPAE
jgi:HEAT repeat protein